MASIEKRGKNYRIIVSTGKKPDGTYDKEIMAVEMDAHLRSLSPRQLEKELEKIAAVFEKEVKEGKHVNSKLSVQDLIDVWYRDYASKKLQPKTLEGYEDYLRRITKELGSIKFKDLTPVRITQFYNKLLSEESRFDQKYTLKTAYYGEFKKHKEEISKNANVNVRTIQNLLNGKNTTFQIVERISACVDIPVKTLFDAVATGKGLDPKTVQHHHRLLTAIFNKCIQWKLIDHNPAVHAECPNVEKKEAIAYSKEQAIEMFQLLSEEPLKYQAAIYIALYGGLRLGEVTGLEWKDVDFEKKTINIVKARQYTRKIGTYDKTTKTPSSLRKLSLSDDVMYVLEEHKKKQDKKRQKLGELWKETNKIFTQWNGEPMFPQTPSKWFAKWLVRKNLEPITFHQLRHSHASILIAEGVDIVSVSKRLGHSKVRTTLDYYAHAYEEADRKAAEVMDNALAFKPEKERVNLTVVE